MTHENESRAKQGDVRISAITVTFEEDDSGAGDAWRLGIVAASAYEVEEEDGVYATRRGAGGDRVPWSDVPEDLRNHACEIFRSLGFTLDEIQKEAPIDEE